MATNNELISLAVALPRSLSMLRVDNNPLAGNYLLYDDFLVELMSWHPRIVIEVWNNIYEEVHAIDFAVFLRKLRSGSHSGNRVLKQRVANWLDYLAQEGHEK